MTLNNAFRSAAAALVMCWTGSAFAEANVLSLPSCPPSLGGMSLFAQTVSLPKPGVERSVEVGGTLAITDTFSVAELGLTIEQEATVTDRYFGSEFVAAIPATDLSNPDNISGLYRVKGATFRYTREKGDRHGLGGPDIFVRSNLAGKELHVFVNFGLKTKEYVAQGAVYHQRQCQRPNPNGLRTEILYNGSAKGVMSLQYREFSGNTARPAFSQEATFDLSLGNELAFKGVRIKVLSVTNAGMRYVVLPPASDLHL